MAEVKEREEQAQIIINTAVERVRAMGFGIVADGTVYGDGVWIDRLRVRLVGPPVPPRPSGPRPYA